MALEPVQVLFLAAQVAALTLPFLCTGLVVGAALAGTPEAAGRLYAASFLGGAAGALAALALPVLLGGPGAMMGAAALAACASGFLWRMVGGRARRTHAAASAALAVAAMAASLWIPEAPLSPYKTLSLLRRLPDARVVFTGRNAISQVDVIESAAVRSAPGLSITFPDAPPALPALTVDGEGGRGLPAPVASEFTTYLPTALAYQLRPGHALVVGAGVEVLGALEHRMQSTAVVEANPLVADAVRRAGGPLFRDGRATHAPADGRVEIIVDHPRTFVRQTAREFDHPNVVRDLEHFDAIGSARGLLRGIGQQVDLVIALTHMEIRQDLALAREVPQIHAIVGGHTEGFDGLMTAAGGRPVESLNDPPTVYVKTHRLGATLGRLDLTIEGGRVRRAVARNLPVTSRVTPDPQVAAVVKEYEDRLQARFAETVGRAAVFFDGERDNVRTRETNLGNLVADDMRQFASADVAVMNGGGIRGSFREGPITLGDAFRVLAFDNTIVVFRLTGAQLREALENGVSQVEQAGGRFPQVSGLAFTYERARLAGQRVMEVRVGGAPLYPARSYLVATNDFMAGGGDGYTVFRAGREMRDTQVLLRDLFIEHVRRVGTITARVEGRIVGR